MNRWPFFMFHFDGRSVEQLAAGLGARFLPAWLAGQLRQHLSFNLDQERVRNSTQHVMDRHQDMLAGMVIFSFGGLW